MAQIKKGATIPIHRMTAEDFSNTGSSNPAINGYGVDHPNIQIAETEEPTGRDFGFQALEDFGD